MQLTSIKAFLPNKQSDIVLLRILSSLFLPEWEQQAVYKVIEIKYLQKKYK